MKKVAAMLLLMVFVSSSAFGGTVAFDPPKLDLLPGQSGSFELSVIPDDVRDDQGALIWDAIVLHIGSGVLPLDPSAGFLTLAEPVLSPDYRSRSAGFLQGPADFSGQSYASAWIFGSFVTPEVTNPAEFLVATIDVMVPSNAVDGDTLSVMVNTANEGLSRVAFGAQSETTMFGLGTVNVIPEPATIVLLGFASLALIARRRRAA